MKLLRLLFVLTVVSFTFGCGPGGPPPVIESESADPIDDVDTSLEEGLTASEDGGGEGESVE